MNRREFLSRRGFGEMLRKAAPLFGINGEGATGDEAADSAETHKTDHEERRVMEGYLSSPLYSYALLSEMPWDMLIDEARRCGIPYEGRIKMDVVRELFVGTGGKEEGLR
ncbi:MAG: hypothetical protein AB9917_05300 [Negativicutes bacterium]